MSLEDQTLNLNSLIVRVPSEDAEKITDMREYLLKLVSDGKIRYVVVNGSKYKLVKD